MWNVGANNASKRSVGNGLGLPSYAATYWRIDGSMEDIVTTIIRRELEIESVVISSGW